MRRFARYVCRTFGLTSRSYPNSSGEKSARRQRKTWLCCEPIITELSPDLPTTPSPQDRERYDNKHRFLKVLEFHPRFEVRKGKVLRVYDDHGNADYVQKGVDVQLSIDLVALAARKEIQHAVLLAADDDFTPAVRIAKNESVVLHLAYCPKMPRGLDLERETDERIILDTPLINTIKQY